jgi:hypothetical protein
VLNKNKIETLQTERQAAEDKYIYKVKQDGKDKRIIGENNKQFTVDLKTINSKVKENNAEAMQLSKDYDAQAVAIGNLKRTNDALFRRVNYLDVRLDRLSILIAKFESTKANVSTTVSLGGGE